MLAGAGAAPIVVMLHRVAEEALPRPRWPVLRPTMRLWAPLVLVAAVLLELAAKAAEKYSFRQLIR